MCNTKVTSVLTCGLSYLKLVRYDKPRGEEHRTQVRHYLQRYFLNTYILIWQFQRCN